MAPFSPIQNQSGFHVINALNFSRQEAFDLLSLPTNRKIVMTELRIAPGSGNPSASPSHLVTEWSKDVSADEIGDGGREEDGAVLPHRRAHRKLHPQGQRGLQHRDPHVRERDRPCHTQRDGKRKSPGAARGWGGERKLRCGKRPAAMQT